MLALMPSPTALVVTMTLSKGILLTLSLTLSTRLTARGPPVSRSATSHTSHPTSPPHGPPPLADSHSALLEHSPPWYNLCEGFAGMQSLE